MGKREKKQFSWVFLIAVLLAVALAYAIRPPPEPRSFAATRQFETAQNMLFSYEITRYPSGALIVPPDKGTMRVGLIVDPWNLHFGRIPRGEGVSGSRRFVFLENVQEDARIRLVSYGNITPYVSFSKSSFVLKRGENATVDVLFRLDDTISLGNYSGEIDVIVSRPAL